MLKHEKRLVAVDEELFRVRSALQAALVFGACGVLTPKTTAILRFCFAPPPAGILGISWVQALQLRLIDGNRGGTKTRVDTCTANACCIQNANPISACNAVSRDACVTLRVLATDQAAYSLAL